VSLGAIYRHIGEELYKPLVISTNLEEADENEDKNDTLDNKYIKSKNPNERILSYLIILRTLNHLHVDYLITTFELLKNDLKCDVNKDIFLEYYGIWTLLKWLKLANKPLLTFSIDILLVLSIDSFLFEKYLNQCSNETWFSQISVLMRHLNQTANIDLVLYEKLSVLLQKLSKPK
jgi:hypothetical protein